MRFEEINISIVHYHYIVSSRNPYTFNLFDLHLQSSGQSTQVHRRAQHLVDAVFPPLYIIIFRTTFQQFQQLDAYLPAHGQNAISRERDRGTKKITPRSRPKAPGGTKITVQRADFNVASALTDLISISGLSATSCSTSPIASYTSSPSSKSSLELSRIPWHARTFARRKLARETKATDNPPSSLFRLSRINSHLPRTDTDRRLSSGTGCECTRRRPPCSRLPSEAVRWEREFASVSARYA